MLRDLLPAIYQGLLSDDELNLNPIEKRATCTDCYKLKKEAPTPRFNSKTKCCTYYPFLPNYLVGGVLSDSRMDFAQKYILNTLVDRGYATPLGVSAPPAYQKIFNQKRPEDYGQCEDLLCPYYLKETGLCGVWAYRGHECTTYYCHSSYGENGEKFWQEIRDLLFELEMFLSQTIMVEFGYKFEVVENCLSLVKAEEHAIGEGHQLSSVKFSKLWGDHCLRPKEFYIETFQFVKSQSVRLKQEWNESRKRNHKNHTRVLSALILGGEV